MNRLPYLKRTLQKNIEENAHFPGIEFVVLDYNSPDGTENWIGENMSAYMESGVLKYYKTYEPEDFYLSHSKNMSVKLASGDIICNIDADNYSGPGYAAWVSEVFERNGMKTLITTTTKDEIPYRDQGGKLCFSKELFLSINGYDESMRGYGMEDIDLVNRLEKAGGVRYNLSDEKFLQCLTHSNQKRLENHYIMRNLDSMYVQTMNGTKIANRVFYLFKNKTYFDVTFDYDAQTKEHIIKSYVGWKLRGEAHVEGSYEANNGNLHFSFDQGNFEATKETGALRMHYNGDNGTYFKEIDREHGLYEMLVMAYTECYNRHRYWQNDEGYNGINAKGWGKGIVYCNLDKENPIEV